MTAPVAGASVTAHLTLVRELGRGGMGLVWVAEHHVLKREVAVKLLDPERHASAAAVARFEREAASVARVRSPYVVAVQDAGVSPTLGPYLVMELLVGRDLAAVIDAEGALLPARASRIVGEIARGLAKAHERGLVHRDVKAENVFLCAEPGEPEVAKVLDFGIALGDDERLTDVGVAVGTRLAMSPEQAAGRLVDARSDAYSLAFLAYRLLTGEHPISRASFDALGLAAYRAELPAPSASRPALGLAVDAWFAKATAHDPAERYPDVVAMADALGAALRVALRDVDGGRARSEGEVAERERGTGSETREETRGTREEKGIEGKGSEAREETRAAERERGEGSETRDATVEGEGSEETRAAERGRGEGSATREETGIEGEAREAREATTRRPEPRVDDGARDDDPARVDVATSLAAPPAVGRAPARRWTVRLVGLAAVAFVLVFVRGWMRRDEIDASPPSAPTSVVAEASAPVELVLLMDVSGANRKRGAALERAAKLGATLVSEAGGVRGRAIAIATIDDQGDTAEFLAARGRDAVERAPPRLVLGPLLTAQAEKVLPLFEARQTLEISASATGHALGRRASFVGLAPSDDGQAAALAALVRGTRASAFSGAKRCTEVAIVATSDAHGEPFARALEAALATPPRLRTTTTLVAPAPRRSYEELRAVVGGRVDCLVLVVSPKIGARVLGSIDASTRARLRVLAGDTLATADFVEFGRGDVDDTTSPSVANGVEGVAVATAKPGSAELRTFERRYLEAYHEPPDEAFAARQFDAVVLAALALERAGLDATAPALREALVAATRGAHGYGPAELGRLLRAVARGEDVDYEGASGDLTFGSDGRVQGAFDGWSIRDGKLLRSP